MQYRTVIDSEGARVKTEVTRNVFATGVYHDKDVTVIEPEKARMLISSPTKEMCMRYDLKDMTPISLNGKEVVLDEAIKPNAIDKALKAFKEP
jgi:hypothetical protein